MCHLGELAELVKEIFLDTEGVGFESQRSTKILINHFKYFSAKLSQVRIQHDSSRLSREILTARELCQVLTADHN